MVSVEGQKCLCTQISTREVRKVKQAHRHPSKERDGYLPFSWNAGNRCSLHPGDTLLSDESGSARNSQKSCFTHPRTFPSKSWTLLLGHKTHSYEGCDCTYQQPRWFLHYLRARPMVTDTGLMFTSTNLSLGPKSLALF